MKRFLIHVTTAWCGMDQEYVAIAHNEGELEDIAQQLAYNNFIEFDLLQQIVEKGDYYSYTIEEWDETRPEHEWGWYELIYNKTNATI